MLVPYKVLSIWHIWWSWVRRRSRCDRPHIRTYAGSLHIFHIQLDMTCMTVRHISCLHRNDNLLTGGCRKTICIQRVRTLGETLEDYTPRNRNPPSQTRSHKRNNDLHLDDGNSLLFAGPNNFQQIRHNHRYIHIQS